MRWEFMLLGADKPLLSMPELEEEEEMGEDEVEDLVSGPGWGCCCCCCCFAHWRPQVFVVVTASKSCFPSATPRISYGVKITAGYVRPWLRLGVPHRASWIRLDFMIHTVPSSSAVLR